MSIDPPGALPRRYHDLAPSLPEGSVDLFEFLPGNGEIEMEIGFGRGSFLIERAEANPSGRLLGIEIKRKWAHRVDTRLRRLGLDRVRVVAGDARLLLSRLRPDGALARVHLHFPDPWWKKRHAKRRLIGEALLAEVARLLRPGGELFMQTDVRERAEGWATALKGDGRFELAGVNGFVDENPYGARSNREKRAEQDGLPVHRVLARRREVTPR